MSRVVIVYHSGFGPTHGLAEAVRVGIESHPGGQACLVAVEAVEEHWDDLHRADAIIFGAPTCMGSLSAPFRGFMDATAAFYLAQPWRDKLAAGFTHADSLSGDTLNSLLQLAVFASQHAMVWVGLGLLPGPDVGASGAALNRLGCSLGAMAQSSLEQAPGSASALADLRTAACLGQRVAQFAARLAASKAS